MPMSETDGMRALDSPAMALYFSSARTFGDLTVGFAGKAAVAAIASAVLAFGAAAVAMPAQPLRIANVTVVDVKTGVLLPHRLFERPARV